MIEETRIEDLTYEQAFAELQAIIELLEAGEKPLDESLALFERGQTLYQRCISLLDKAEMKVQQLSADGELSDFEG